MKIADLHLVQIITAAGYRKTDFTTEQIIEMAVGQTADTVLNGFPADTLPKTLDDLSQYHLSGIIFEAKWDGTPAAVANAVLENGYKKECEK